MRIKANTPWFEFAYIGILLWLTTTIALLSIARREPRGLLAVALLICIVVSLILLINKRYRTILVDDPLVFKGYFWGSIKLRLEEIREFKLKELKSNQGGTVFFSEYVLIIYRKNQPELKILQDNYKEGKMNELVAWLTERGIKFIGRESFSWRKSLQDLLKGKIIE